MHLILYGPSSDWTSAQSTYVRTFINSLTVDYAATAPSVVEVGGTPSWDLTVSVSLPPLSHLTLDL